METKIACQKCGRILYFNNLTPDETLFCPFCNAVVGAETKTDHKRSAEREIDVAPDGKKPKEQSGCIGCLVIFLVGVFIIIIISIFDSNKPTNTSSSYTGSSNAESSEWEPALGNMWSGVKLYVGSGAHKEYLGQIRCFRGGSGGSVYIINFAGSPTWAKRDDIIDGPYYVRKDDPALNSMEYYDCDK